MINARMFSMVLWLTFVNTCWTLGCFSAFETIEKVFLLVQIPDFPWIILSIHIAQSLHGKTPSKTAYLLTLWAASAPLLYWTHLRWYGLYCMSLIDVPTYALYLVQKRDAKPKQE